MVEFKCTITDEMGLHARPAGLLVKAAGACASKVTVINGAKKGDAKRIFGLMSLGVKHGDEITIQVEGDSEAEDAKTLEAFCAENL